jgi:hypothetical protein
MVSRGWFEMRAIIRLSIHTALEQLRKPPKNLKKNITDSGLRFGYHYTLQLC